MAQFLAISSDVEDIEYKIEKEGLLKMDLV